VRRAGVPALWTRCNTLTDGANIPLVQRPGSWWFCTACVSRETPAGSSMHPTYNMLLQTCGIRRAPWFIHDGSMACAMLATEAGKPHWRAWGSAQTCRASLPAVELECTQRLGQLPQWLVSCPSAGCYVWHQV
jgi:hypothetical protein